jgi:hypothetical protein
LQSSSSHDDGHLHHAEHEHHDRAPTRSRPAAIERRRFGRRSSDAAEHGIITRSNNRLMRPASPPAVAR